MAQKHAPGRIKFPFPGNQHGGNGAPHGCGPKHEDDPCERRLKKHHHKKHQHKKHNHCH